MNYIVFKIVFRMRQLSNVQVLNNWRNYTI